ncbi:hypothetical protein B0F90DRAFT_1684585 [Multifurca ochricompacta]|uniref:non-specific serine/threonine protein kinase n=1 Tax=Multifurca ochricompacta TaxID=376703 RepID=A0AAD4QSD6_9AGAM|nr:hypothetical protein B0F90DRAFT_1684585 [Multifurca ochricompacta]
MLRVGARTKQVFSYGRRNRRIINDRHDLFDGESTKRLPVSNDTREHPGNTHAFVVLSTPPSKRRNGIGKGPEIISGGSSTFSPLVPSCNRTRKRRENKHTDSSHKHFYSPSSARQPLNPHSLNISRRPSLGGAKKKVTLPGSKGESTSYLSKSPVIDVDIFVLDEKGRRVSQERRASKTNVQVNQRTILGSSPATYRNTTAASVIVISDSDDDDGNYVSSPHIMPRARRWPKAMLSSDDEDVAEPPIRHGSSLTSPVSHPNEDSPRRVPLTVERSAPRFSRPRSTVIPKSHFWIEITNPRPQAPLRSRPEQIELYHSPPRLPRNKQRQLTPIGRKGPAFPQLPPSPSTVTDLDISFDLTELTLSSAPFESHAPPKQPPYLLPLLEECGQSAPVEFSAFIEAFPVHPIVRSSCTSQALFEKIGEASYSEVFGIGDVVLKIIPIRNEECSGELDVETPAPSDAKDVLKEIVVTRALGEMCSGFVSLLKTYVVRGKYPSLLLNLWDEYNQTKGSESVRPDMLAVSQVYAIIVLPNGGPDLETYTFTQPTKTGWRQACSLFWQVARALATAENLVSFEHRDLHWGQILVKEVASKAPSCQGTPATDIWLPMDHQAHGVKATVIDLGLARMEAHIGNGSTEVRWTPWIKRHLKEKVRDYQFDIYRLMRKHNGDCWADFHPLSNVMWLHYLLIKLLKSKNLRPPRKSLSSVASQGFTERQCYECLLKMESLLAQSMRNVQAHKLVVSKHGRRKRTTPTKAATVSSSEPQCAGDVLRFGESLGWV